MEREGGRERGWEGGRERSNRERGGGGREGGGRSESMTLYCTSNTIKHMSIVLKQLF